MHDVYTDIKNKFRKENFNTLSIGMSSDYELAIKHGSTMIRVGSSIFNYDYS